MAEALPHCQICFESETPGPIFQCSEGHLFCDRCWREPKRSNKCPSCLQKLPTRDRPIRCRAIEAVLDARPPLPCEQCEVLLTRDQRRFHTCQIEHLAALPTKLELVRDASTEKIQTLPLSTWSAKPILIYHLRQPGLDSVVTVEVPLQEVERRELCMRSAETEERLLLTQNEGLILRASLKDNSTLHVPFRGDWTRSLKPGTNVIETYAGSVQAPILKKRKEGCVETRFEGNTSVKRRRISVGHFDEFYEGDKGQEALRRMELPDGCKNFYEGSKDQEVLRRAEFPDGRKHFFEGSRGQAVLRRAEFPDGCKNFYVGSRGQAVLLRTEFPDGRKKFYEGPKDQEALRRMEFPDGSKKFYEGSKGQEALHHIELPDGRK